MWAEALIILMRPSTRFMTVRMRPVLPDASLKYWMFGTWLSSLTRGGGRSTVRPGLAYRQTGTAELSETVVKYSTTPAGGTGKKLWSISTIASAPRRAQVSAWRSASTVEKPETPGTTGTRPAA